MKVLYANDSTNSLQKKYHKIILVYNDLCIMAYTFKRAFTNKRMYCYFVILFEQGGVLFYNNLLSNATN